MLFHMNPAEPTPARRIALCLSGGGFRATLFHLGVIRYLQSAKLLVDVKDIVAVSGGSVLAADLALNWSQYTSDDDFQNAEDRVREFCGSDVRGRIVRRAPYFWLVRRLARLPLVDGYLGRKLKRNSRYRVFREAATSYLLIRHYDALYKEKSVGDLMQPGAPRLQVLSTSLNFGKQVSFSDGTFNELFDKKRSVECGFLPISYVVAASSAFPLLFRPLPLDAEILQCNKNQLSDLHALADGGVVDNMGIRQLREHFSAAEADVVTGVIVSDAGAYFDVITDKDDVAQLCGFIDRNTRCNDITMELASGFERAEAGLSVSKASDQIEIDGKGRTLPAALIAIRDTYKPHPGEERVQNQNAILNMRTDLDRFSEGEADALIAHGFSIASRRLPELFPELQPVRYAPSSKVDTGSPAKVDLWESRGRSWRLFSFGDWVSWATVLLAAVCILAFAYPQIARERKVTEQRQTINSLNEVARGYFSSRLRPIVPGASISYLPEAGDPGGRGTVCCFVERIADPAVRQLLSTRSAFYPLRFRPDRPRIIQPAWTDQADFRNEIGTAGGSLGVDDLDAATAILDEGVGATNRIPGFRPLAGTDSARNHEGKHVLTISARKGIESVFIISAAYRMPAYPGNDVILLRYESAGPTDMPTVGAPVFTEQGILLGMVTDRTQDGYVAAPIEQVFAKLGVRLVTE